MLRHRYGILAAAVTGVLASTAAAQVDNVVTVVPATLAVGSVPSPSPLGAFGYDPVNDRIYTAGFSNGDQELRKIDLSGVNAGTFQSQVFATSWLRYNRDNDLNLGGGTPTPSSILLNPLAINLPGGGTLPAYGTAIITDACGLVQLGSGTTAIQYPEKTKKLYAYNLQQSSGPIATDVFTTRVTVADLQAGIGGGTGSTSNNIGRQPAWSGDGQSVYFIDSGAAFGGLWKVPATGGPATRLLASSTDMNTEPAVITAAGVDTIFFRGGGTTGNVGGIDKVTHDGTTTGARTIHVAAADIAAFFEQPTSDMTSFSMAADAAGNLFFNNTATARRGIFKLDPQGRLIKVLGYEERRAAFNGAGTGNPNANTLRMQPRMTTFGSGSTAFAVAQILYTESSGTNYAGSNQVAGAYLFKAGDFDRDNDVDQTDIGLFKSALTLRGVALSGIVAADKPKLRFDLNGNNEVSYKDVKILQQFYAFPDGDADINKTVDLDDFTVLAANFGLPAKRWTEGDFTGDETVNLDDFTTLAANFGVTSPAEAASRSAVPEPAGLAMLAAAAGMLLRRRK